MGPASEKLNCIRIEAGKIFNFHDQNSEQSVVIVTLYTIILTTCNASRHSQLASHWPGWKGLSSQPDVKLILLNLEKPKL